MAINPNNGVLDIINGTLKVSSIDIKQAGGFTTAINTIARNDVLLYDDQDANTTFTPREGSSYRSATGVTRDTTAIDLNDGWVYWPLQLPNSWHTEFDMHVTTTGGVLTYSLFNTTEPNHTDYTANDGGYKIVFDNTQNQIDIRWQGSVHATTSANIRSADWQHVNINYFQGAVSISLAGKVVLTHKFTENYQEFDSRYVGFSATSGASHKIRHLIVHNSDKWLYTKTSNASDISYISGNVGIGSLSPTELLDVHGNVHIAKDLTVDGNLTVSGTTTFIDTQNLAIEDPIIELAKGNASDTTDAGLVITRPTSNVTVAYRGDEEELALGYTQSGASDVDMIPVADGGLNVRVYGNLFANNLTTTANVEATYLKGDGSELTGITLESVVDYGNVTSNTIQLTNADVGLKATGNVEANYFVGDGSKLTGLVTDLQSVTDNGNTTSNTVQFTNATTALIADSNVGIGTSTPSANLHVVGYQYVNDPPTQSASFDHSDAPLTLTHGTPTSTTAIDDPKAVLHLARDGTQGTNYGARASFNLSRYENSGTASRSRLDVTLADGTYAESNVMSIRADGKVGVGTTAPGYTLDVAGDINLSGGFYQGGAPFVSSLWTDGTDSLYYRSNVEAGTANLFVDTTKGYVGIGTTTPTVELDIVGNVHVSNNISGNSLTLNTVNITTTTGLDEVLNVSNTTTNTIQITNTSDTALDVTGGASIQSNLEVGTANLFVDTTTGNVGVGTAAPGYTLDVVGDIHLTGNILQESGTEGQTDTFYVPKFITSGDPAVDIVLDDQEPTTTFTGTLHGTASRVTGAGGTGYLELTTKSTSLNNTIYWQDTLPAKWTCEFEWYLDPGSYGGADDSRFIFYGQSAITSVFPADHGAPYVWLEHYGGDIFAICDGSGTTLASTTNITFAVTTWIRFKFEFDNGVLTAHAYNNQSTPTTISYDFGSAFSSYYNTDTYFALGGRTGGVVALQRARNFHTYVPSTESIILTDVNYTIDNSNSSSMKSLRLSDETNGLSVLSNISVGGTVNAPYFVGDGSGLINVNSESFTTSGDIITTSGKIGVGVAQPETSLYMYDNSSNVCTLTIHDGGLSRAPKLDFLRGGSARTGSEHQYGLSNYTDWRIHVVDSTGAMLISNKSNTSLNNGNEKTVMAMDIYGKVGIGTNTGMTEKLTVDGNIDLSPVYGNQGDANKSGMIIFNKPINQSIDTSTNIDTIYFNDSTKAYHFTKDTTKYATGNAGLVCGTLTTGVITRTAYNPGEVIETLQGRANGRSIQVLSGTYTITNVTATQQATTAHTVINGSSISYKPPAGTTRVIYEFSCFMRQTDAYPILHFAGRVAGTQVTDSRHTFRETTAGGSDYQTWIYNNMTLTIGEVASDNLASGQLASWTANKTIDFTFREYSATYEGALHTTNHWDGSGTDVVVKPVIKITAIA